MISQDQKNFLPPGSFIKHLIEKREIGKHRSLEMKEEWEIYSLDLKVLQLNVSSFTPFVVDKRLSAHKTVRSDTIEQNLPELHKQLRTSDAPFIVLVIGGTLGPISPDAARRFRDSAVAVIDLPVIEKVLNAPDNKTGWDILCEPLVRFLGRHALSPYVPRRIATGGRFFGRVDVLNQTIAGKYGGNFSIMGNRRIGKTSLLREIKRRLLLDNERLRTADVYGNICHSTRDVVKELLLHLRPEIANRLADQPDVINNLPAHISFLPDNRDQDVAVFVDEVDHILEFDEIQQYQLLHLLRASFEHERCRIFFAGFRKLMQAKKNLANPLYNFTRAIALTGLNRSESHEMIAVPLSHLGIKISAELTATIVQETSGHPELIQFFCSKIVDYDRDNQRAPRVGELLNEIFEDEDFRLTIRGAFLQNTNPIEKILCYRLFQQAAATGTRVEGFEFTLRECDDLLKEMTLRLKHEELDTVTQNLRIGGTLTDVKGAAGRYRFAVPRLAQLCIGSDLEWSIEKEMEEFAAHPKEISLHMQPVEQKDEVRED